MKHILISILTFLTYNSFAQTIPINRLSDFVACVHIAKPSHDIPLKIFDDYSFVPSSAKVDSFLHKSACYDNWNVGTASAVAICPHDGDKNDCLNSHVLNVRELKKTITILNDCADAESMNAILALWNNKKDSLEFNFMVSETIPTSLGSADLAGYSLFQDSSILVVVKVYFESFASFHFIRLNLDHRYQFLFQSPSYCNTCANGDVVGYQFVEPFSKYHRVLLPTLKTITLDNGDLANVIDEKGPWKSVDLWKFVKQKVHH